MSCTEQCRDSTNPQLLSVDPNSNVQETHPLNYLPSDPPNSPYFQSEYNSQPGKSNDPHQEHISSTEATIPPMVESSSQTPENSLPLSNPNHPDENTTSLTLHSSDDTDSLLSGFPRFPYRDVPHFVLDDNLF